MAIISDSKIKLSQWLQWQENAHPKAWDLGLQRVAKVWQLMGAPRIATRIAIVAGTNGKGSCVRWAEEICIAHEVSVATFTSPHLNDYRERIRFDGRFVSEEELLESFAAIDSARANISLTYFEWSTLAAFYLMAKYQPQIAVLEVGLGGRFDATNIIDADAAIITRIGLDHLDWLGKNVDTIAMEKAGVFRNEQRIAFADANPPQCMLQYGAKLKAHIWRFDEKLTRNNDDDNFITIDIGAKTFHLPPAKYMPGKHQLGHFAAVAWTLDSWLPLRSAKLADVMQRTRHIGRLTTLQKNDRHWLLDVAHNADSAEVLAQYLTTQRHRKIYALCAMLVDKEHEKVFASLQPIVNKWFLASTSGHRACDSNVLWQAARRAQIADDKMTICDDIDAALATMMRQTTSEDLLVVTGSFITVARAVEELNVRYEW